MIKKRILTIICVLFFTQVFLSYGGWDKDQKVSGIIFFKTKMLPELNKFYLNEVGCTLWMDQGGCQIFKAGNMLFGFCHRDEAELDGVITFFYPSKEGVDHKYKQFKSIALSPPKTTEKYRIYHFFAKDPEGRIIEFQYFLDPIKKYR